MLVSPMQASVLINAAAQADPELAADLLLQPLLESLETELRSVGGAAPSKVWPSQCIDDTVLSIVAGKMLAECHRCLMLQGKVGASESGTEPVLPLHLSNQAQQSAASLLSKIHDRRTCSSK